jgi:hypothetical protein
MSSLQTPLSEPQPHERTNREAERRVYFTANGSRDASLAAYRAGADVGMASTSYRPPEGLPVRFVDWPFLDLAADEADPMQLLADHLDVVRRERPHLAVAPDVDGTFPPPIAFAAADRLADYAREVVVVPKTILPSEVPERFVVGLPCQRRYGPAPWRWREYRQCGAVHLLGGSPQQHIELLNYLPVRSVDTTTPVFSALHGSHWEAASRSWVKEDLGFAGNVEVSYLELRRSLNPGRRLRPFHITRRRQVPRPEWGDYEPADAAVDPMLYRYPSTDHGDPNYPGFA